MARFALSLSLLAALTLTAAADDTHGFVKKTHKNPDGTESPYVVFVPHNYDGKTELPVVLFLHGAGETKGGKKQPVEVGIGPAIKKMEKEFGAFVVIPQAETRGWQADGPNAKRALRMLDEVMAEYKTDPKRQYLTGLSMGGFGTWSLAAAHPDRWAAIAPICGGAGNAEAAEKVAEKIKDIPCWCFHGDADPTVKVDLSRTIIDALKKAGGKPRYTEYPKVGHNSWDPAYAEKDFFPWLMEQKRK
jgi:predicted peptidase